MKGRISIGEFIHKVKDELVQAQDRSGSPFYELSEVTLEVSFALDISAKTGADLYVIDLSGETKAQQIHKVTLKLLPLQTATDSEDPPKSQSDNKEPKSETGGKGGGRGGGGGGLGGILGRHGPVYDKR